VTPTQRSLALLRRGGWTAEVVERWNSHARIRHDLFGCIDILAVRDGETLGVQTTSGSGVSARLRKLVGLPVLDTLHRAGWCVQVHGWRKVKLRRGGKASRWDCRIVDMAAASIPANRTLSGGK
jgi:hypothetical protein